MGVVQTNLQKVVLELVIGQNEDITDIQYLLLVMQKMFHDGLDCTVLVSAGKGETKRYTPVTTSDYFRLAHSLYFYRNRNEDNGDNTDHIFEKIYECFFVYHKKTQKGEKANWASLPRQYKIEAKENRTMPLGRVFPQIPITKQIYSALTASYSSDSEINSWIRPLKDLCNGYFERLKKGVYANRSEEILKYLASDSCFETLLFLGLCNYIEVQNGITTLGQASLDLEFLHETCMNFAQGVLQLVENVVTHVLGDDGQSGCGILTIRYRKIRDAEKIYLDPLMPDEAHSLVENVEHFMELYLTDIQYENFQGIVDKFKANVEQRCEDYKNSPEQRLVHMKFHLSQSLENASELIKKEDAETQEELNSYIQDLKSDPDHCHMSLSDFLGQGSCKPFVDYLSTPDNIAFHYGLPILNSVVMSMNGYFYVQSGAGDNNCFENSSVGGLYKHTCGFLWEYGTSYTIYVPLRSKNLEEETDYLDLISWRHDTVPNCRRIDFKFSGPISVGLEREDLTRKLWKELGEQFKASPEEIASTHLYIGVIDCEKVVNNLSVDRLEAYEVMVKAIFLYLADKCSTLDNLALVNVTRPYDVIKLFRLFALFFDRAGNNRILTQKKSLFLVDSNGKLDILFHGNNLKSIKESLSVSCLYGGMTDTAIKIAAHLLGGRNG
ncbi:hypothetical protein B5F98_00405 [Pseudoflavonifractor sp. An44]|nr:hypothetical protein B5F98_00405 [Pseudoflavonifractor sp. An44]